MDLSRYTARIQLRKGKYYSFEHNGEKHTLKFKKIDNNGVLHFDEPGEDDITWDYEIQPGEASEIVFESDDNSRIAAGVLRKSKYFGKTKKHNKKNHKKNHKKRKTSKKK
jgi:hypothetical protein